MNVFNGVTSPHVCSYCSVLHYFLTMPVYGLKPQFNYRPSSVAHSHCVMVWYIDKSECRNCQLSQKRKNRLRREVISERKACRKIYPLRKNYSNHKQFANGWYRTQTLQMAALLAKDLFSRWPPRSPQPETPNSQRCARSNIHSTFFVPELYKKMSTRLKLTTSTKIER